MYYQLREDIKPINLKYDEKPSVEIHVKDNAHSFHINSQLDFSSKKYQPQNFVQNYALSPLIQTHFQQHVSSHRSENIAMHNI